MDKSTPQAKPATINLLGLYAPESVAGVRRAVELVKRSGLRQDQVSVLTSEPYGAGAFGTDTGRTHQHLFSALGGVVGFIGGIALAAGTALLYPIVTGGKPIVAWPTVGVVTYEITMLGIILMTLIGALFEARLPRLKKPPYDERISDGYLGLILPCEAEHLVAEFEAIMLQTGAVEIKTYENPC